MGIAKEGNSGQGGQGGEQGLGWQVIGISIGCLLGMFPLLFMNNRKDVYFDDHEKELFDDHFKQATYTPLHSTHPCNPHTPALYTPLHSTHP